MSETPIELLREKRQQQKSIEKLEKSIEQIDQKLAKMDVSYVTKSVADEGGEVLTRFDLMDLD